MSHQHIFEGGFCTVCGQTQKNCLVAENSTSCCDTCQHDEHSHEAQGEIVKLFMPAIVSLLLLLLGLCFDQLMQPDWFKGVIRFIWYLLAYWPVGLPVIRDAVKNIAKGNVFSEFFLMGIATVGAFVLGEYPEGVAVMLFYTIGENFQSLAVRKAKANIKSLLDQRPDEATLLVGNTPKVIKAREVEIDDVILLKPGEKLALDGELLSDTASFNTAALTGESKPDTKTQGEVVLAGMINLETVAQVKVTAAYEDSKLSKILDLVQHATTQKAPTELFISKFAKIYTPIVVFLAIGIVALPALIVADYSFDEWLYRGLVFLVISCPCALVISIPLGYFGGIGAASRHGILVKGSHFLDVLADTKQVVMDKTGTLTEGVFEVQDVQLQEGVEEAVLLKLVDALESNSSHPAATAIHRYTGNSGLQITMEQVEEIAGHGLKGMVDGQELLVGNFKLLDRFGIRYDMDPSSIVHTTIAISLNGAYQGYITIADKIREQAQEAVKRIQDLGVNTTMLSGDKRTVVSDVARQLGIEDAYGDLLPDDKVQKLSEIKERYGQVAFVGDGVNDAPVVALSDVGLAMGGLGSDATIETADVVIQDDNPVKIPMAIRIGRKTKQLVWQNITLAFGVKVVVLVLGAGGLANMWEAVFADVGVALLAILNAVRIQRMDF